MEIRGYVLLVMMYPTLMEGVTFVMRYVLMALGYHSLMVKKILGITRGCSLGMLMVSL